MPRNDKVKALLASASSVPECVEARVAWIKETTDAWGKAQKAMDDRLTEAVMRVSEEEFDRMFDEEQAKVDALREPMMRAYKEDAWPRALHAKCV
jgi:dissimilatory sulfite reductase (desulfoviridin) alpha/beta subunit